MYVTFIFIGIFLGFSFGSAPIISYHYGAKNETELKSLFKKSTVIIVVFSTVLTIISFTLAGPLSKFFVGYDIELLKMTTRALSLFSFSFLFSGINIYISSFFTALNNGLASALISFLRTLLFQVIMIFTLPLILGLDGIWLAVVAAEVLTLFITFTLLKNQNVKYKYF